MINSNKLQRGLTLIELVVVLAVIVVIALMASSSYTVWVQNTMIRTSSESIQTGLQLARAEAVNRNASVQLDLRGLNSAWTVCLAPVAPGACPNPDNANTIQSKAVTEGGSANIAVTTSDAGPFVFSGLGVMTSPAPTAASGLVTIGVDNSALSTADSRDLRVIIGVGGSSRTCDPTLDSGGTDPRKCP